jgi:uncharacterized protein (DUF2147 family)
MCLIRGETAFTQEYFMKKLLPILAALLMAGQASAQMSPVGRWHTVDDKTGELKSEVLITESAGTLTGVITRLLGKDANQQAVCNQCTDDRKGKPIMGLQIIRGVRQIAGKDGWDGGKILDPQNGKTYTLRLAPVEDGRKLEVRGSIGPFGVTQIWSRVP